MNPFKAEVGSSIGSLLESAEDLLSRCRAVDVEKVDEDEEEFSDVKEKEIDAVYKTSLGNALKWLEVLFRSGLAPDHSAQCPPHPEASFSSPAGDQAYFR